MKVPILVIGTFSFITISGKLIPDIPFMEKIISFFNLVLTTKDKKTKLNLAIKIIAFDVLFSLIYLTIFAGDSLLGVSYEGLYQNFVIGVVPIFWGMAAWIFFEELTARVPISFFINKKFSIKIKLGLIATLSFLFSMLHLPSFGFWEILIIIPPIFVGAITYSLIYILAGANRGKILIPFLSVFFLHLIWDVVSFTIVGAP